MPILRHRFAVSSAFAHIVPSRRFAVRACVRVLAAAPLLAAALAAHAVIVRGRLTDPLGKPVPGGQVKLIEHGKVVALAYAGADGTFEIRSTEAGRFTLLGSGPGFLPYVGTDFYGGATDVMERDVVLSARTIRQEVTVTATGIPTPLPQLTAPVTVIPEENLATRVDVVDEMRQEPGAFVVQTGQYGGVTSLFMRGGDSKGNLVLIDGMPASDIGGAFDFGEVSPTGIGRMDVYRGPDSAVYGTDAEASVVEIDTRRGTTLKPLFTYSGDAGNLHTWRDEVTAGGTWKRLDYFGAFGRFDSSNALPDDEFHNATSSANVGYSFNGNNTLRVTARDSVSAEGLPDAHDFYGISNTGKQGDQDVFGTVAYENRTESDWHTAIRYGLARKREQETQFGNVGTPITFSYPCGNFTCSYTEYFGDVMTIRGANGYTATGQAAFLTGNENSASDWDQVYYESDWTPSQHFSGLFGFRWDNERGSVNDPDYGETFSARNNNFEYNLQFQGEYWGRLFYSLGGSVVKNHVFGIAGAPRAGLAYAPVRPSSFGWFHGTRLRANAATGVQEPTLAILESSIYYEIGSSAAASYGIGPPTAQRSRTYDIGLDQNIYGERLTLKAGYFHNVFDHQIEGVYGYALPQYFPSPADPFYYDYFEANTLAFRAQGAEAELNWQMTRRMFLHAGYTYLDARVVQSLANDALNAAQGYPTENPNLPGIAIGAESPLIGGRPFRRAPNSGFFTVDYNRTKWNFALKGAFASRSDDSTYLDGETPAQDDSLILPNHDLDFGYLKLDLSGVYRLKPRVAVFAQLNNLLNDQHIGPIGYPALPFTFRAGMKFRLGGD